MGGLLIRDLNDLQRIFVLFPQIQSVLLFGSRAKGNYKNGSDVDLAVRGENIDYDLILELQYELNENTVMPYRFDIIHMDSLKNEELLAHIQRVGKILYEKQLVPLEINHDSRELGFLVGKGSAIIHDDFKITSEEFLGE